MTAGADVESSPLADHGDGHLEQNLPVSDCDKCCMMDHRADQRYFRMAAHQLTPGVRYVTPVGSSLQTPYDGRIGASQQHNMLNGQNFHCRDAGRFHPHFLNPVSGVHTVPEATPFQAIVSPLDKHNVTHSSMASSRPRSWHVSPSRKQHGGLGDTAIGIGKTPSFRRTPGARRPSIGSSPQVPQSCPPMYVPRPLFPLSSSGRTALSCGTNTNNETVPNRKILEKDFGKPHSVDTMSVCPDSLKSNRGSMESPRFESGSNVTSGVELVVSNLDYNISSHEWKKILTCELQQQVQVFLYSFLMLRSTKISLTHCVPKKTITFLFF